MTAMCTVKLLVLFDLSLDLYHQGLFFIPLVLHCQLSVTLTGLVKKLLLQFMNAEYICAISDVSEVNLDDPEYYLPIEEVYIGQTTMLYLEDNDDITSTCLRVFR